MREGKASLVDAFATVDQGEVWLRGLHIPEYSHGSWTNHVPKRARKLLLHRREIDSLMGKVRDGNITLVPLSLYFVGGRVKVELAVARGKQAHDKRQDLARRTAEREAVAELGRKIKGMRASSWVWRRVRPAAASCGSGADSSHRAGAGWVTRRRSPGVPGAGPGSRPARPGWPRPRGPRRTR